MLSGRAFASDAAEFWPELSAFIGLQPGTRVYLDTSIANGKEADQTSQDVSANLDLSLKPILRPDLHSDDWQRNRWMWARIGYTRVSKVDVGRGERSLAEDRGVVAVYGRIPLPAEVWLETRTRADLRWIGGDYSTRYRFRLEANREFRVKDRPVLPCVNVEWFYDTRYAA
jgi:hypothetical protein